MRRTSLAFLAGVLLASCQTFQFPESQARQDLVSLAKPGYPSFAGSGRVLINKDGRQTAGVIRLAIEGGKFRLEILDKTGLAILAAAGNEGNIIQLDPSNGKRKNLSKALQLTADVALPSMLLKTMVTGAPPDFGKIISTEMNGQWRIVTVSPPAMRLSYKDRLMSVEGGGVAPYKLDLGPLTDGPLAPYVAKAQVSIKGMYLSVAWESVRQGVAFPRGFFSFEEDIFADEGF